MNIFQIVLPIFAIIALGYGLRKWGIVEDSWVHVLNNFVYYISLPAIIVISFWQISWSNIALLKLAGFNCLVLLCFVLLVILLLHFLRMEPKLKAAVFLTAVVGNTIYMGFPLVGAVGGGRFFSEVVGAGTVHLALGIVFAILGAEFYVVKSEDLRAYAKDFIKHPLIISMVAGILLSFLHLPGIGWIQKSVTMLGNTASPVALFALGGFLHGKWVRHHYGLMTLSVVLKLAVFPLFLLAGGMLFGFTREQAGISALLAAMPTAVTAFVVAEKYRLDKTFVANCIILTTVISLLTLSVFLWVLRM